MSGSGPAGPILKGVWQSLQPEVATRYLPRFTFSAFGPVALTGICAYVGQSTFDMSGWLPAAGVLLAGASAGVASAGAGMASAGAPSSAASAAPATTSVAL